MSRLAVARPWRHLWDVFAVLTDRDLKAMYKRSVLGIGWAMAAPLLQLVVFSLVFRRVLSVEVEHYASFAFLGLLVWGWFQAAISQGTSLVVTNQALVRQPGFPLYMLPVVSVGVRFIHLLLALPILFVFMAVQGIRPGLAWVALPLVALVQFALTTGISYPLAALNVRLRDTQHVVFVLLQLLMFLTPVFYSMDSVPERLRPWFSLNPMTALLGAWRDVLLHNRWPAWPSMLALAAIAVGLLGLGRWIFATQAPHFADDL